MYAQPMRSDVENNNKKNILQMKVKYYTIYRYLFKNAEVNCIPTIQIFSINLISKKITYLST